MSSYNAILARAQKALATYLGQFVYEGWTPAVYRGISSGTRTLPCIICDCRVAEPEDLDGWSGNWKAEVRIIVVEQANDTTHDEHLEHAGEVFDKIVTDTPAADINLAAGAFLTVHKLTPGAASYDINERTWESSLQIELLCSGGVSPYTYSTYSYDMGYVTEPVVEVIDAEA